MGSIFCSRSNSMAEKFDEKKTVKVTGVSRLLTDQITKTLQSKSNTAGISGDVTRLFVCPHGKDYVLVEFSSDTPDIPSHSHGTVDINGTTLRVESYVQSAASNEIDCTPVTSIWEVDDYHRVETRQPMQGMRSLANKDLPFLEARVKVNDKYLRRITPNNEILQEKNVELDKDGYLSGTWTAICDATQSVVGMLSGGDPNGNRSDEENDPTTIVATPVAVHDQGAASGTQTPEEKRKLETIIVRNMLFRYIITYHHQVFQRLENVCQGINFEMNSNNEKKLTLTPRVDVSEKVFSEAFENFVTFYQKQNEKTCQEVKTVRSQLSLELISEASYKYSVIIDLSEESKSLTVFGEKAKAQEALKFLARKFESQSSHVSTQPTKATGTSNEQMSCLLSNNVRLFVYQGDITKEKVDAIVNPANERLQHSGGAAEAIVKAGGSVIQAQSNDIMKKRRSELRAGEVETTAAGRLPCKMIVHAVGPRRSEHDRNSAMKYLNEAVMNSLMTASKNNAESISIPAISSGVFGIPLDLCTDVLFNAAETFAKNKGLVNKLKEIRFVNIDKSTTQEFMKEMVNRYQGNVKRETRDAKSASPPGPQNKTAATDAEKQIVVLAKRNTSTSNQGTASNSTTTTASNPKSSSDKDECSICLSDFTDKKTLDKCSHSFCAVCIKRAFQVQKKCPLCSQVYGPLTGNQPDGRMIDSFQSTPLPGFNSCGTICITYIFERGIQGADHPNPGKPYPGTRRYAYLPDSKEGRKVLRLLKKAFDQKLTFTIGQSSTSGANNVITWNDIHHKTNRAGGPTGFGYPDPDYLKRVQEELAAKGITE